jgi:hypothetical protein
MRSRRWERRLRSARIALLKRAAGAPRRSVPLATWDAMLPRWLGHRHTRRGSPQRRSPYATRQVDPLR